MATMHFNDIIAVAFDQIPAPVWPVVITSSTVLAVSSTVLAVMSCGYGSVPGLEPCGRYR